MIQINIKLLSDEAYLFLKNNLEEVTKKIQENGDNKWVNDFFPKPVFIDKKIFIPDFELIDNPESKDKDIDFENSKRLYESLNKVPNYILCDDRFWLWLHLEKFYPIVKRMMKINSSSTIKDHWLHAGGTRRGLFFGVLSRCYFRVDLTIDNSADDKYVFTKWVIDNPLRFREFTWRTISSQKHIILGCLKGEKRALDETGGKETGELYAKVAKHLSNIGSVKLLDAISKDDIEEMIYNKTKELLLNPED